MGLRPWHRLHHASVTSPTPCASLHGHGRTDVTPHTSHRKGIRVSSSKVMQHTKTVLSKQAKRLAKKADEHEQLITKVTYLLSVLGFGVFCYMLGARPHDIPFLYVAFFMVAAPLRWVYYRAKKWHYFLLDFCYYANLICTFYLLFFSKNEKLFLLCFAFSEGPLAWALIVWRCSLVFSSVDKIVSVLIHLLPGTVVFIIRWWDPVTFSAHPNPLEDGTFGPWPAWPQVESSATLWLWMFAVPLGVYALWQLLYFAVVYGLRKQRLLSDPEVLTSFRELARKASKANNVWWRISGALGDDKRILMYALIQAAFTVLTMALTVPMFCSYHLHAAFQFFKVITSIWNGGNFFLDVLPKQMHAKVSAKKQQQGGEEQKQQVVSPRLKAACEGAERSPLLAESSGRGDEGGVEVGVASLARAVTVGEVASHGGVDMESRWVSSLALEGSVGGRDDDARPCHACGRCGPKLWPSIPDTGGVEKEEGDAFHPACSELVWMDGCGGKGMSSWEDDRGAETPLGMRRRSPAVGHQQQEEQPGAAAGLEVERSIWQGGPGGVACIG